MLKDKTSNAFDVMMQDEEMDSWAESEERTVGLLDAAEKDDDEEDSLENLGEEENTEGDADTFSPVLEEFEENIDYFATQTAQIFDLVPETETSLNYVLAYLSYAAELWETGFTVVDVLSDLLTLRGAIDQV